MLNETELPKYFWEDVVNTTCYVGYEQYFVGFEERMMNQLHTMQEEGRTHHQYCETRFQDIEGEMFKTNLATCSLIQMIEPVNAYLLVSSPHFDECNGEK